MSDYPSEDDLERIKGWDADDPAGWLAFIRERWHFAAWGWHEEQITDDFDRLARRYSISTGGWSGNEDIIGAMRENWWLWSLLWQTHRRGGHFTFELATRIKASTVNQASTNEDD